MNDSYHILGRFSLLEKHQELSSLHLSGKGDFCTCSYTVKLRKVYVSLNLSYNSVHIQKGPPCLKYHIYRLFKYKKTSNVLVKLTRHKLQCGYRYNYTTFTLSWSHTKCYNSRITYVTDTKLATLTMLNDRVAKLASALHTLWPPEPCLLWA